MLKNAFVYRYIQTTMAASIDVFNFSDAVLEDVLGLKDRFVKFWALASTALSLALALVGLGFYAVLGSRTLHFQKFNFATCLR